MDRSNTTSSRSLFSDFTSNLRSGVTDTVRSTFNVLNPNNLPHTRRQTSQVFEAIRNPRRTFNALRESFEENRQQLDVPRTLARTSGDMLGSSLALLGMTMTGVRALRQPYLATRTVQRAAQRYRQTLPEGSFLRRPQVENFMLTRPLAFTLGGVIGTAAFVGGSQDRWDTANENRQRLPNVVRRLQVNRLEEPLATPVSRIATRPQQQDHHNQRI